MSFKTILVAGASRGIGLAIAEHLFVGSDTSHAYHHDE
jgi:NAD(P)-dependent dehydrogenase (short-subunit alcohol dehydrogenase family)